MTKDYNQNFKDQVLVDMKQSGLSAGEAAKKYKISPHAVYKWLDQVEDNPGDYRKLLKEYKQVKAQNEVLCSLVKKFSADSLKKK